MKKIIIVTPLFPPNVGGPARQSFFLKEFFDREGVSCALFSFDQEKGPKVKKYISFFAKILKNTRSGDKLVVFDELTLGIIALLVSKIKKVKMIVRLGGDRIWEKATEEGKVPPLDLASFYKEGHLNVYPVLRFVRNRVLSGADILIFSSLWYRDIIASATHTPKEKTKLIKNKKEKITNVINKEKTLYQFIYAGRFTKVKNVETLVRSFHRVSGHIKGNLLLCGSGPQEKNIRDYIAKNNLENRVSLIGPQDKNNIDSLIQKSAICVLPSLSDISPNFLLECQSLGKISLATENVGIREDLRGVLYGRTDDVEALAENILKISAPERQEKLQKELAENYRDDNELEWRENWRSLIAL